MATMLSPPGLFSTTTGWPHLAGSRSANSRAPMSAPAPGPNGTMNLTVLVGQFCAVADSVGPMKSRTRMPTNRNQIQRMTFSDTRLSPAYKLSQSKQTLSIAVGDPLLVDRADRDLLQEGARPRHGLIGIVGRKHDPINAAEFKQQVEEGWPKVHSGERV